AFDVLQFRGKTSAFLEAAPGAASLNVLKMAREGLLVELRSAVLQARRTGRPVHRPKVRVRQDGHYREIALEVIPPKEEGADGRLRRASPSAERLFNLIPTDIGRRLADLKPNVDVPDLPQLVTDAVETMATHEREIQDVEGNWYLMRVRPYRTIDNRVEGAV